MFGLRWLTADVLFPCCCHSLGFLVLALTWLVVRHSQLISGSFGIVLIGVSTKKERVSSSHLAPVGSWTFWGFWGKQTNKSKPNQTKNPNQTAKKINQQKHPTTTKKQNTTTTKKTSTKQKTQPKSPSLICVHHFSAKITNCGQEVLAAFLSLIS